MRERGRQVLTTCFMVVTGGIAVSVIAGSVYFLLDPTLSLKRLLAIPLIVFAANLARRIFVMTGVPSRLGKIGVIMGVPLLFMVSASIIQALHVHELAAYGRKLIDAVFSR